MLETNCPNCGAAVRFRSASLPVNVCGYCRSTLVRSGEHLQALGKIAQVPDDVSPLQIGTRGIDGSVRFELIGRVRMGWKDGGWNEWLALFDDGTTSWLSEAMGRYMLLRKLEHGATRTAVVKRLSKDQHVAIGSDATIDGTGYRVTDVKAASFVGSEGELPFSTPATAQVTSIDLMASDGSCASIQKDRGDVAVYVGRYVTLADIHASNLRAFDGWPMPQYAA